MLTEWRRHRAVRRVRPGDGSPLKRFRWWQLFLGRALLHLDLTGADGRPVRYSVDVRHQGSGETGQVVAQVYRDGRHHASSRVPAVVPVEGGAIEVATSAFGVKRCRYVTAAGAVRQLVPDPRSAEGRRARLEREHPSLSRVLGAVSVVALVVGVGLNLLQLLEPLSRIPPVAAAVGVFESPVHLPIWLNITLGVAAALASTERALRLRYHWLLDGVGN
jgi:catechol 2,3-dioxygenase-like lactoylglutathione lyase family enzyme